MKIAILGATSHIAKGLIFNFSQNKSTALFLFARSPQKVTDFLKKETLSAPKQIADFAQFAQGQYDVVINCVGLGTPDKVKDAQADIFQITEQFDDLVITYLKKNPASLYINFSSGAVYGTGFAQPVTQHSKYECLVNALGAQDYYAIAKLASEAKHRAFASLNIVDLRVFAYFSRFIDLQGKYLITEILNCVKAERPFVTGPNNIVRDYCHPEDLYTLVNCCIAYWQQHKAINAVYDVYSCSAVTKMDIVDYFKSAYQLAVAITAAPQGVVATGNKDFYCSQNQAAKNLGYVPKYSALDCIKLESAYLLTSLQNKE